MRILRNQRGTALVEAAVTLPIILLIAVAIFDLGRAFQTWQVMTNAAREGARVSVLANATPAGVEAVVRGYMQNGQLSQYASAPVTVNRSATIQVNGAPVSASQIQIDYPLSFIALHAVSPLVSGTPIGSAVAIRASALMRNESP